MNDDSALPEPRIAEMVAGVTDYLRKERARYLPASGPLSVEWKSEIKSYFPDSLLETVRVVELEGAGIPQPSFYAEAMELSSGYFPDFTHLASITYGDVIVFSEKIASRGLFHGLVHAQQMAYLGLNSYADLYLRGFLKTRSWLQIPLEKQVLILEERFLISRPERFSVEEEVKLWAREDRYR